MQLHGPPDASTSQKRKREDEDSLSLSLGSIYSTPPVVSGDQKPASPKPVLVEALAPLQLSVSVMLPAVTSSAVSMAPAPYVPRLASSQSTVRRRAPTSSVRSDQSNGLLERPPFPWATNRIAKHESIAELMQRGITSIEGESQCKHCELRKTITYDLEFKFQEVAAFIMENRQDMDDRAPSAWLNPTLPACDGCKQENCMRPSIPTEKENINWLFLLLGQTIGLCTLDQLKYFCMHTKKHRTGAKDRVLYSTYFELCNQLWPDGTFNVASDRKVIF